MSNWFGRKKEREGEAGHRAAERTRDNMNEVHAAGEDVRKNVNAFSDNLVGGNREHGGTDFHHHAQRVGDEAQRAADKASDKLDEQMNKTGKESQGRGSWFGGSGGNKESKVKDNRGSWFGASNEKKSRERNWQSMFGNSGEKNKQQSSSSWLGGSSSK